MNGDNVLRDLARLIAEHGWAVRLVAPRQDEIGISFAYTVGLTAMGHPEVVEQGLPNEVGHAFLNIVGEEVRDGRTFDAPSIVTDLSAGGEPMAFLPVQNTSELTAVEQVYGHVDAIQLIWSDSSGRLPWDPEFGPGADAQPLLGTWNVDDL